VGRYWIRGTSGSGKTTLARQAGERLRIPAIDLDDLHWLPGWEARPKEEFRALIAETVSRPAWIISGNYGSVRDLIGPAADTIVWLDYRFPIVFGRVLRRTIGRVIRREVCCNGNRERILTTFFSRDSILWWCITTHRRRHRECLAFLAEPAPEGQVRLRHRHPRETAVWLASLDKRNHLET